MSEILELEFWGGNPAVSIINGVVRCTTKQPAIIDSRFLLITNVPSTMNCSELLHEVLADGNQLEAVAVLVGSEPNFYLVLLLCPSVEAATSIRRINHGRAFSGVDGVACHIVWALEIFVGQAAGENLPYSETPKWDQSSCWVSPLDLFQRQTESTSSCAVCLELLCDPCPKGEVEAANLATRIVVLCGHTFHGNCLKMCCDVRCPICRYQQHPFLTSCCDECGTPANILMCLICGFVGCSKQTLDQAKESELHRSRRGHAREHFDTTQHTYALEISSQRVWDFSKSAHVHRLIRSRPANKVVEVESQSSTKLIDKRNTSEECTTDWLREFNEIMSTQLDSQNEYFEAKMQSLRESYSRKINSLKVQLDHEEGRARSAEACVAQLELECHQLVEDLSRKDLASLESEICYLENRQQEVELEIHNLDKENEKERDEVRYLEQNIENLRQQLRDFEIHLAAASHVSQTPELRNAPIGVVPRAKPARNRKR